MPNWTNGKHESQSCGRSLILQLRHARKRRKLANKHAELTRTLTAKHLKLAISAHHPNLGVCTAKLQSGSIPTLGEMPTIWNAAIGSWLRANRAYEAGDAEALRRILDEYHDGADAVKGEGIGAELIRIIRQISQAKDRIAAIERELETLLASEIAQLKRDAEKAEREGRDLLAELAASLRGQIEAAEKQFKILTRELKSDER
jgi:hypothetical protein